MKQIISIEIDNYRDAKYLLGVASLLQSIGDDGRVVDVYADVPVAAVLLRTAILAKVWLSEVESEYSEMTADEILNVNEEMSVESWGQAFELARQAQKIFFRLLGSSDKYMERYRKFFDITEIEND